MRRIKTALVGLELSGRTFHLPFLKAQPQFEVGAVLSRQKALAQELVPDAACCEGMNELLQQDVEPVVIWGASTILKVISAVSTPRRVNAGANCPGREPAYSTTWARI